MGVTIAAICRFCPTRWEKITQYGNLFILLSVIVLAGACFLCKNQMTFSASVFGFPLIAVGYGLRVIGAVCPTSFLYHWKSKSTTFIATLSYAIYLTHKGVIHMTHHTLSNINIGTNMMITLCILSSIGFAYILHLIIEKPFMHIRKTILTSQN